MNKNKSPGFYVSMNLRRGMFESSIDYKALKSGILAVIEEDWGPRCKTKDIDDFPDEYELTLPVDNSDIGRCPVCLVYEKFDAFWEKLYFKDAT